MCAVPVGERVRVDLRGGREQLPRRRHLVLGEGRRAVLVVKAPQREGPPVPHRLVVEDALRRDRAGAPIVLADVPRRVAGAQLPRRVRRGLRCVAARLESALQNASAQVVASHVGGVEVGVKRLAQPPANRHHRDGRVLEGSQVEDESVHLGRGSALGRAGAPPPGVTGRLQAGGAY